MAEKCKCDLCLWNQGGGGGGGGGSSTLAGLTDVDISNPSDGQTLVYNATSGKWENGSINGGDIFVTLGTINADIVTMTYDEEDQVWIASIDSNIDNTNYAICAGRNLTLTIDGHQYSVEAFKANSAIDIDENTAVYLAVGGPDPVIFQIISYESQAPVITNLSLEVYAPIPELGVFFSSESKPR